MELWTIYSVYTRIKQTETIVTSILEKNNFSNNNNDDNKQILSS